MSLPPNMLDAEIIATMIAEWAGVESPSYDVVAVNAMMDLAEAAMHERGAAVERTGRRTLQGPQDNDGMSCTTSKHSHHSLLSRS